MKKLYHFIYIFLIVFLSVWVAVVLKGNNKINAQVEYNAKRIEGLDEYYKLMRFRDSEMFSNNGTPISPDLQITDETGSIFRFADLSTGSSNASKLIVRYSPLACDICLEEELKQIGNFLEKIGIENVIILASNHNIRSLKALKNRLQGNLMVCQVEKTGIPFEESNSNLFVFVLDKDMTVKDFFIPEKTLPNLSKDYYEAICSKYWQMRNETR
jgi:hypothetical protein